MASQDFWRDIKQHFALGDQQRLAAALAELQPADLAEGLALLTPEERVLAFNLLDGELAGLVLAELDVDVAAALVEALPQERVAAILSAMSSDNAADLLGELPEHVQQRLLGLLQVGEAEEIQELLEYAEDTAGGIMTTEYVALPETTSAAQAIEILRATAPDAETVYYVYVVDQQNRLVGVISLRELITADPATPVGQIMHRKVISVHVDMDQEEVARVVSRYNLLAVPVVDRQGALVGIVTVDDVIDVIQEEATEDFFRLAGTSEEEEDGVGRILGSLRSRLPWLIVTLVEGALAGQILRGLERELQAVVALAFFIPLLTGMGGNVGTQSATLTVRGLATGQIGGRGVLRIIGRESLTGLLIGIILGILVAGLAFFWQRKAMLGLVVGLAMVANMTVAATMGTLVPLFFRQIGVDPAVASAPFISASIDITGLLIYSTLATLLITHLL